MTDKPLNYRQSLFVKYYTDGDTKGNCEASMVKAGFGKGYARKQAGQYIRAIKGISDAIAAETALIEVERLDSRVFIDNQFKSLLQECLIRKDRVNAARCLENMAKHRGYYAEDNAQQAEQTVLSTEQQAMYEDYLAYRRRMLLEGA